MSTPAPRIEHGVNLDALPTREGWEGWDFIGDFEGTVQAYRQRGDYGVTGNPNNEEFWVAFAYDGISTHNDPFGDPAEAMDAADREARDNPIPDEKCVR